MSRYQIAIWVGVVLLVASQTSVQRASADTDMLVTNVGGRVTIGGADELETANEHFELTSQVFRRERSPGAVACGSHRGTASPSSATTSASPSSENWRPVCSSPGSREPGCGRRSRPRQRRCAATSSPPSRPRPTPHRSAWRCRRSTFVGFLLFIGYPAVAEILGEQRLVTAVRPPHPTHHPDPPTPRRRDERDAMAPIWNFYPDDAMRGV